MTSLGLGAVDAARAQDLPDPLSGVAGDADDLGLRCAGSSGLNHQVVQVLPPVVAGLLGTSVGLRGGFQFAGHMRIVPQEGWPT